MLTQELMRAGPIRGERPARSGFSTPPMTPDQPADGAGAGKRSLAGDPLRGIVQVCRLRLGQMRLVGCL